MFASWRTPAAACDATRDTQDLKVLQAILDEAKGQPGLAGMRKMLNKMVKRIKAVQVGGLYSTVNWYQVQT